MRGPWGQGGDNRVAGVTVSDDRVECLCSI